MKRLLLPAVLLATALLSGLCAAQGTGKIPQRADIDPKYKWKLEGIYATDDLWDADVKRLEGMLAPWAAMKGHLSASGDSLLQAFRMADSVGVVSGRLYAYASMRRDEDNRVPRYLGEVDRLNGLFTQVGAAGAYMSPEILGIPQATLDAFLKSTPALGLYRHALDDVLRRRPHTLPEPEERLLALSSEMSGGPGTIFGAFDNADLRYGSIRDENGQLTEVTKARWEMWRVSPDRRVRRDAFQTLFGTYAGFNNTLGACLNADVKGQLFYARARKYDTAVEASLDNNNIPVSVYRNLVATVNANLGPLHRYAELRKKWMGLDTLRLYDLYVPLVPEVKFDVSFEAAQKEVVAGLQPLGETYLAPFRKGLESGWIDVYETQGKTSGAYSGGTYSTQPYVLLNWSNTLDDEFTLAHEMGHSLHSYFTWKTQPPVYANYSTFVAEVASTGNEALFMHHLLQGKLTREQRMYLINHQLEQIRGTFFRQTLFAEFELRIHEMAEKGEPLTAEAMNKLYADLYRTYYGPALTVDSLTACEWSRIPHFYMHYYVWQYATSFAASMALSQKVLQEGQPAVDRYLGFLKAGSSDYPIEILKHAGVDMSTPAPIEATVAQFSRLLDELEKLHDSK
ncbi:MAG TPA: oligoendopeptidase F [Candidatus Saccharimonadales bacterium]|nr:oligoendopeptidase F [Candidatus Saccharimonadales bacterium]